MARSVAAPGTAMKHLGSELGKEAVGLSRHKHQVACKGACCSCLDCFA